MLTFHLDFYSTEQFIRRVLHTVKLHMGASPYRVVEVVKLGNVRIKGYYTHAKCGIVAGRSEYNATVDVSVNVRTVQGKIVPLAFQMQNPIDLSAYNLEIERAYHTLDAVQENEERLVTDYTEALQSMVFFMPTGMYSNDTYELIGELSCLGDISVADEGYKAYNQLQKGGQSITSIVGFTCTDEQFPQSDSVTLWNVLAYAYLHEFLVYKQDWYETYVKDAHNVAYAALIKEIYGVHRGLRILQDAVNEGLDADQSALIQCSTRNDTVRNCIYYDVGYFAENMEDIIAWYHFTPLCCLRLIQLDGYVSFEIVYDVNLHDYAYIIESYADDTPFISRFLGKYLKLM